MTTDSSCPRELSDGTRVINRGYRKQPDLPRSRLLSSSSSSSSFSGIATPVDGVPPKLVAFPKFSSAKAGLTSSGSSSSSLDRHRARSLSFSRTSKAPLPRPAKLSLESAKASPIPAIPCASEGSSPQGAFSLTSSAEGHLRALVTRDVSAYASSKATLVLSRLSAGKRERASSLRSFPVLWASISDIEEEEETFWPHRNPTARRDVPTVSRSQSPSKSSDQNISGRTNPRTRFASLHSMAAPKPEALREDVTKHKRPAHTRVNSYSGPFSQSRTAAASRFPESSTTPRTFLKSTTGNMGKRATHSPLPTTNFQQKEKSSLDPALAAVESASRLRAKCVCVVCGKLGVDYPRCPRCGTTWCSRECRISASPAGSARHSCATKNHMKVPSCPSPLSMAA